MRRSPLIHEPGCASLDVAPTADWDDPHYKPPACTCNARTREKIRRALMASGGEGRDTRVMLGNQYSPGCYIQPIRRNSG